MCVEPAFSKKSISGTFSYVKEFDPSLAPPIYFFDFLLVVGGGSGGSLKLKN